ncbi:hypothetical protein ACN2MM_06190 [Alkalilimnicola ehrlichii MLHE-1]|uniref:PBP domain-containing protein n=1 Tax=Alkalilimnicola ehrlichii (strain ATCC BAA-1101 / DSM 17681 / MLHE-1) TaxID=187272 RepID=Q0A9M8_ALKEH|nr:hypothetical protein [Alkalilimnicola ehrlichii]ABI56459.1 conserved hypothetical protein [Alkalilimnicola ehrlichii MLHE-1]
MLAWALFSSAQALAEQEPVYLVAHPGVGTEAISRDAVRAMFAMRQRHWPDGTSARVFVLTEGHPVHERFVKGRLDAFPHQLQLAWDRAVFSGTGQSPHRVGSQAEMHERVATTPGALGYLTREYLDERVQIIAIE